MNRNNLSRLKRKSSQIAVLTGAILLCTVPAIARAKAYAFDIPQENAASALNSFARQADVQLLFPYDLAVKTTSEALRGTFSREEALAHLIAHTGLEIASQTDTTITLRATPQSAAGTASEQTSEVVITGSHIRGGNPTAPLHALTRSDIDQSGYSQIGDLMRSLPENFSGGQNPGVIAASATNSANANASNASTINLRGLGTDATLVLLNGHRLSGDSLFQGADISGIPLGAVQRIEVVADGASALYGSDAVAGVVNIFLRKTFDGARLSARVGNSSQGGGGERTYSALLGTAHKNWHILANVEYAKQDAITAGQRDFTKGAPAIATLWQPQVRRSVFLNAGASLSSNLSISLDAMINDRDTAFTSQTSSATYTAYSTTYTPAYAGTLSLDANLPKDWRLRLVAGASGSRNRNFAAIPAYAYESIGYDKNFVRYEEGTADGVALHLPTGEVKIAMGVGHRDEGFRQNLAGSSSYFEISRTVDYAYGEVLIPLVAASETRTGLNALELSLSGRSESYSDFGSSTNPRIGLRYVPGRDLTLRASWGQSFKAPSFFQMYSQPALYLYPATATGYSGGLPGATIILLYGGNAALKPEQSTSWTLGADYSPRAFKSLKLSATYFNIDYTDRVVQPVANLVSGMSNPIYAPFVERNPSSGVQASLIASVPKFFNYASAAYDPTKVVGIIHNNFQNATAQAANGIDISYRQIITLNASQINLFANATWLTLKQQTISTLPLARLSGTIFNPPSFKGRGGATWSRDGWTASGIVNYVDSMRDTIALPERPIGSWTTFDANLAYAFPGSQGLARGLTIDLSVSNLFDKMPPHAVSPTRAYQGISYDSTNASIVGRFTSLTVTKSW